VIRPEHVQFEPLAEPAGMLSGPESLAGSLSDLERSRILEALRSGKSRTAAAQTLGISARTLRYKLARLREAGVAVPTA
jgi:two-component system, response regulator FlrC